VSAISDGVLSAYIPLLEVLPEFRGRGIGTRLMRLVLERLEGFSMVDLSCDEDLVPFYLRFGMQETRAMSMRRPHAIPTDRP
jgi:ribosomal protein S18 acetylase RimI-like enzyme